MIRNILAEIRIIISTKFYRSIIKKNILFEFAIILRYAINEEEMLPNLEY